VLTGLLSGSRISMVISAVADYTEVRNIRSVSIRQENDISLRMLFDPEHNLEERILNEQFVP
jgi:NAD+ kinase